ncbi:MAG: 1-acyl-sn-glycerol-3-phosphate acyltransferase [Candidatus Dependentiae bacterium]|nr:1-acyl-sn-glycerol-3-phosphate acyltransferase [Candidatus Dependentiae bacterium]
MKATMIVWNIYARCILFILMSIYLVPMIIILLLPARWGFESKYYYWMEYSFCWLLFKLTFFPVTYSGQHNMPGEPAVIVANHQSSLDIPLLVGVLQRYPHLWLALNSLMKSPILRFILPKIAVLVDTSSPLTGMRTLIAAIKKVNGKRCHVVIFPEGGRYYDSKIHDFFAGFVILAKKMNRPIVPVFIKGANVVYPPNSFWVTRAPITITVGEPMRMEEGEPDEVFHDRVHQWFIEQNKE